MNRTLRLATVWLVWAAAGLAAEERFSFSGARLETTLAQGRERTILTGNAQLISDDTHIRADRIELFGDNFSFAVCTGNVSVVNTTQGIELTSDNLFYDREAKVVRIQGGALMVDRRNEVVVKGSFLEYWEGREEAVVQIGVRILKTDLASRSEFARYSRRENTLELHGLPVVNWKGDEYRASRIFIDLGNDLIRLEGEVEGRITLDQEGG